MSSINYEENQRKDLDTVHILSFNAIATTFKNL